MDEKKHAIFRGRLVFVGFGSIGQGTLPLILRHIDMPRERITILTGDNRGRQEAAHYGVKFVLNPIRIRISLDQSPVLQYENRNPHNL